MHNLTNPGFFQRSFLDCLVHLPFHFYSEDSSVGLRNEKKTTSAAGLPETPKACCFPEYRLNV